VPLDTTGTSDPAVVEDFYGRLGNRALVQMTPAEALAGLDAELAHCGWSAGGRDRRAGRGGRHGARAHG
jgi:hypothetical protein